MMLPRAWYLLKTERNHFGCLSGFWGDLWFSGLQEEFSNEVWGERGKLILSLRLLFPRKQTQSFATSLSWMRFNLYKTFDNLSGNSSLLVYEIIKGSLPSPVCRGLGLGGLQSITQTVHSETRTDAGARSRLVTRLYGMAARLKQKERILHKVREKDLAQSAEFSLIPVLLMLVVMGGSVAWILSLVDCINMK